MARSAHTVSGRASPHTTYNVSPACTRAFVADSPTFAAVEVAAMVVRAMEKAAYKGEARHGHLRE